MSTTINSKINQLLLHHHPGTVLTSSWLVSQGYSPELQKRYRRSLWLDSIGTGAMIRHGDRVDWPGAIHALQKQLETSIHPAALTALSLQGKSQYITFQEKTVHLLGTQNEVLPMWFRKHDWGISIAFHRTRFLPANTGMIDFRSENFSIRISGAARAIMECLYLAPGFRSLVEIYEILEGLDTLRPVSVQNLLENCTSIRVKRLFMYMSEKANHPWFSYLDQDRIALGTGKRSLAKNGVYIPSYQITVPKELASYNG